MRDKISMEDFASRCEQIKKRLYKTGFLYLNSEAMAVDAVDEAFFKGLKSLSSLKNADYFETWLTRILINHCKNMLKRAKREVPLDTAQLATGEEFDGLPLKEAIAKLDPQLKEIIALRYFGGYTLVQTAQILSIPQGTAATRQRKALSLLRLDLQEEEI